MTQCFIVVAYDTFEEDSEILAAFTDEGAAKEYMEKCGGTEIRETALDAQIIPRKDFEVTFSQLTGLVSVSVSESPGPLYQIRWNGDNKEIYVRAYATSENEAVEIAKKTAIREFNARRIPHNLGELP